MRIYLDHNATTPLRDEVLDAMVESLRNLWGNPSSTHAEGAAARAAVERARAQVASCVGADPGQVFFTAGATEANNAVLQSLLGSASRTTRLITSSTEHPSVMEPAALLDASTVEVTRLAVDADGRISVDDVNAALRSEHDLLSLIWANNETGVLQDIDAIAAAVQARGAQLHIDATQALGKIPIDLRSTPVSFLSCSAHKLNGPKGVGALIDRSEDGVAPLLHGGGQEKRWRGGTENVAGIVGFGVACALAEAELPGRASHYAMLRDRLWDGLSAKIPGLKRNGDPAHVLPNTLNVEFAGVAGDVLLQALDVEGVAVSAGAACHSGSISPSHVLTAMGRTPEQALGSLRLSVGLGVDEAQIDRAVALMTELVERTRRAVGA